MDKLRRVERIAALTKMLSDRPNYLFSLGFFGELFGAAKSTLSEDLTAVKESLERFGLGTLETVPGAAGGVKFLPHLLPETEREFLQELAEKLAMPARIIPGGFLYMSDILYDPHCMTRVGEIFMSRFARFAPDYIMTVETKGIPLAMMTARAFDLPLVVVRSGNKVTEGPAVNINYVTGSTRRIQSMSLPRRALRENSNILIIDDFMKAGGTSQGMVDLAREVGARVVGIGVLVVTSEPEHKLVDGFQSLLTLGGVDEKERLVDIRPSAQ